MLSSFYRGQLPELHRLSIGPDLVFGRLWAETGCRDVLKSLVTGRRFSFDVAIDGLIAALVAAPSFVHPDEWVPLVFGGHQPLLDENSPELRAVKTIFNRYNEMSDILADRPQAYRPIFIVDDDGNIVVREWAVGFALGIGLRAKEWGKHILSTEHRQGLVPILLYCEGVLDLLPDMPAAEQRRRQATAH